MIILSLSAPGDIARLPVVAQRSGLGQEAVSIPLIERKAPARLARR
jgi:hypothetical protein